MFYSQSLLKTLNSNSELTGFLTSADGNVAVMESMQPPEPPLQIVDSVKVGDRVYYFVSQAPGAGAVSN
ncbi:Dolichyl-phosphate-mannose-protein mannosyltransferase family protein [Pseudomonas amygdali pv. lachrymans]|uniref:Dolichyl-phosphate-mannose-protein mannosyltransferase family protein n=1 Tax=Pseudomonas amygdali pv. lachrymans TaxID=53707 RepID=A0A0P9SMG0_PSEAV|nr:Dolichyl-phosphate-mannose-protein mannosyltransferase family protein [Pseudomonas amygdali pv. lachrymans]